MSTIDAADSVVLIRVPLTGATARTSEELYEATRQWWVVGGPRRDGSPTTPTHALAVLGGKVAAVYRIDEWVPEPGGGRWSFVGAVDDSLGHYVGEDVTEYFPKGAQNPLRYVNCPAPAGVASAPEPASQSLEDERYHHALRVLDTEPLASIMFGQRELFHSNFIAWFFRTHPHAADDIFRSGPSSTGASARVVHRERHSIDLWMDWPSGESLAIENKVFSLPDREQLRRYAEVVQSQRPGATMTLLSLVSPNWKGDELTTVHGVWGYWSYQRLAQHLRQHVPNDVDYSAQTVRHYADMVEALATVVCRCVTFELDDTIDLPATLAQHIDSPQLLSAVRRMRARHMAAQLQNDLVLQVPNDVLVGSDFSSGTPIITGWTMLEPANSMSPRVGFQLQGGQFRRMAILPHLHTTKAGGTLAKRVEWGPEHADLFDFPAELAGALGAHGADMPKAPKVFNRFEPDFIYRYRAVSDLTYAQLLHGSVLLFEELSKYQGGEI